MSWTSTGVPRGTSLRLAWHGDEPVGLAERGDAAGALGSRVGGEARLGLDQRDHEKLGPAALGCRADRQGRGHGFPFVRRQAGHGPDQGGHEGMKGKIAEVGKPGSTTTGQPAVTATHKGLPGLSATPWITTPGSFSRPTA